MFWINFHSICCHDVQCSYPCYLLDDVTQGYPGGGEKGWHGWGRGRGRWRQPTGWGRGWRGRVADRRGVADWGCHGEWISQWCTAAVRPQGNPYNKEIRHMATVSIEIPFYCWLLGGNIRVFRWNYKHLKKYRLYTVLLQHHVILYLYGGFKNQPQQNVNLSEDQNW